MFFSYSHQQIEQNRTFYLDPIREMREMVLPNLTVCL